MNKARILGIFSIFAFSWGLQSRATQYEPPIMCLREPFHFMLLTKAIDQSLPLQNQDKRWFKEQIRTVLALESDGRILLNPTSDAYPKTTGVKGLTWKEAQILWGEPKSGIDDTKTFDLILLTGPPENRSGYQLDTKFTNGHLSSYRARGPLVPKDEWTSVN